MFSEITASLFIYIRAILSKYKDKREEESKKVLKK